MQVYIITFTVVPIRGPLLFKNLFCFPIAIAIGCNLLAGLSIAVVMFMEDMEVMSKEYEIKMISDKCKMM